MRRLFTKQEDAAMDVANTNMNATRWTPRRKEEVLRCWRLSQGRVLTGGITPHEIAQWDVLEKACGTTGLSGNKIETALERNLVVPAPELDFTVVRGLNKRIMRFLDNKGKTIDRQGFEPLELGFYLTVKCQTKSHGICTIPDLTHTLWHPEAEFPAPKILDVLACNTNRVLKKKRKIIENVWGRGYRLVALERPAP